MSISFINRKSGGSGGDGSSLNIFTQLAEPTSKKGLWIQTEKKIEHITYDNDMFESDGTWSNYERTPIPYNFSQGAIAAVGTNVYLFGGSGGNTKAYKYNTVTDTYTQLSDIPFNFYEGSATSVDRDVYLFGGRGGEKKAYKYNTVTDTYTQLSDIPFNFYDGNCDSEDTDIYLFGTMNPSNNDQKKTYKYDTLNNTYTLLNTGIICGFNTIGISFQDYIYIWGSDDNLYKKRVQKCEKKSERYLSRDIISYKFYQGGGSFFNKNMYLFGGGGGRTKAFKYNFQTETCTDLANMPFSFSLGSAVTIGNSIFLFYQNSVKEYSFEYKTYPQNTLIISGGRDSKQFYKTELYSNQKNKESLKYLFEHAYFYDTKLRADIPVYYGNGTKWIQIKN